MRTIPINAAIEIADMKLQKVLPAPEPPATEAATPEPESWGEIMPWVPIVIPMFGAAFAAVIYVVAWAALRSM